MFNIDTGEMRELPLHAKTPAIHSFGNREAITKNVAAQNNPETFEKILNGLTTLVQSRTDAGETITIMEPSAPYGIGVMVVAGHEYAPDEEIRTETIHDYSEEAQRTFWSYGKTSLESLDQHIQQYGINGRALMTENCIKTISTQEHPTSRSIALPHAQVFITNIDELVPATDIRGEFWDNLMLEQKVLSKSRIVDRFILGIQKKVEAELGRELYQAELRDLQPCGYSFVPSLTGDIEEITRVMNVHHQAYTGLMEGYADLFKRYEKKYGKKTIPQPSYRLYSYLENGIFTVAVSPEIFSFSGVMEAAGIIPLRSETNPEPPREPIDKALGAVRQNLNSQYASAMNFSAK